jgi:hypothetical protein
VETGSDDIESEASGVDGVRRGERGGRRRRMRQDNSARDGVKVWVLRGVDEHGGGGDHLARLLADLRAEERQREKRIKLSIRGNRRQARVRVEGSWERGVERSDSVDHDRDKRLPDGEHGELTQERDQHDDPRLAQMIS